MPIVTKSELRNSYTNQMHADKIEMSNENISVIQCKQQLTVSTLIKTLLEIITIKKSPNMDEETRKQFPAIAKEIIFLAEQTQ